MRALRAEVTASPLASEVRMNTLLADWGSGLSLSMMKKTRRPLAGLPELPGGNVVDVAALFVLETQLLNLPIGPWPHPQREHAHRQHDRPEKRKSGRSRLDKPRPLANQMTISLSRYMRESVPTMAMKRLRLRTGTGPAP